MSANIRINQEHYRTIVAPAAHALALDDLRLRLEIFGIRTLKATVWHYEERKRDRAFYGGEEWPKPLRSAPRPA